MYVGRIVAIAQNQAGRNAALYRVSSRSFPNRRARISAEAVAIVPKPGHETDIEKNPYIAYNCLRTCGPYAVAANGSQTDPIAEKLAAGCPPREALASVLLALDYEHDSYNTPRIAAVVARGGAVGWLGIVRHDAILVKEFPLEPGAVFYVCTYEHNALDPGFGGAGFNAQSAGACCRYILGQGVFAELERPITAACALERTRDAGFEMAALDAPAPGQ